MSCFGHKEQDTKTNARHIHRFEEEETLNTREAGAVKPLSHMPNKPFEHVYCLHLRGNLTEENLHLCVHLRLACSANKRPWSAH